jgi:hypothetical protein
MSQLLSISEVFSRPKYALTSSWLSGKFRGDLTGATGGGVGSMCCVSDERLSCLLSGDPIEE